MDSVIEKIESLTLKHDKIPPEIIREKDVKLGLRNPDGTGVVAGITTKGRVEGYQKIYDTADKTSYKVKPVDGKLYYCGYDLQELVAELEKEERFGFDEVAFLLLTGELPGRKDLELFSADLARRRFLTKLERSVIMEEVNNDNQMYGLHSVMSHLSRCDDNPDSIDIKDVSRQCINLIAKVPTIIANNHNFMRFRKGDDLKLLRPNPELSTAENFLYMLKGEVPEKYEAMLFDTALILHMEHGGGNNSTFAVRVVTSSGANTYMAIAAGIASLSGYLHGGANENVMITIRDLKKNVKNWQNEKQVRNYIIKMLEGKTGDGSGKIYGFGHAVYTLSDPRAAILKEHAKKFAGMKGAAEEFGLYDMIERIASGILSERKGKTICANVDFYSGFIYKLMGIPRELFTPIFAMARVAGWSAHRLEQIVQDKIIRPAYIAPSNEVKKYLSLKGR